MAGRGEQQAVSDRLFTVPNALSLLRLAGVPLFVWAILTHRDGIALATLMLSGITDYLDGWFARRFGLVSRFGMMLDPLADRLYILSTLIAFGVRDIVPWWFLVLLLSRDVVMAVLLLVARRYGIIGLPVHFIGKAATFNLLYAFPLLLLGEWSGAVGAVALPVGWAFAWWGAVLYWLSGLMYAAQLHTLVGHRGEVVA